MVSSNNTFPGSSWRIGVGRVRNNLLTLSSSYKEALSALCMGIAVKSENRTLSFRDLGIYTSLLQERNRQDLNALLSRVNMLLQRHDKTYNTELLNTLSTYASRRMSIPDTATALFVHGNTVRYRINTVKRLLAEQFIPEEVGANLEVICTLSRWADAYNSETKLSGTTRATRRSSPGVG